MDIAALTALHPNISVELEGHVVTVTIDRPESRNGCTGDMWVTLGVVFRELSYTGARAILLTGAGGNFCTGADLTGAGGGSGAEGPDRSAGTPPAYQATILDGLRVLGDAVTSIYQCPIPVIAKVDGLCVGAGVGLSLAADLTWCSDRARFSVIFAKRGLSLDFGTSWLLRQRIGAHKAKELAFTAKMLSGPEAFELGLVNAVVPADDLDRATREVVDTIASGPPLALSITKREINNAASVSLAQALEVEALAQSLNTHSDDMQEAMLAYFERRPPEFKRK